MRVAPTAALSPSFAVQQPPRQNRGEPYHQTNVNVSHSYDAFHLYNNLGRGLQKTGPHDVAKSFATTCVCSVSCSAVLMIHPSLTSNSTFMVAVTQVTDLFELKTTTNRDARANATHAPGLKTRLTTKQEAIGVHRSLQNGHPSSEVSPDRSASL